MSEMDEHDRLLLGDEGAVDHDPGAAQDGGTTGGGSTPRSAVTARSTHLTAAAGPRGGLGTAATKAARLTTGSGGLAARCLHLLSAARPHRRQPRSFTSGLRPSLRRFSMLLHTTAQSRDRNECGTAKHQNLARAFARGHEVRHRFSPGCANGPRSWCGEPWEFIKMERMPVPTRRATVPTPKVIGNARSCPG